VRRRASVDAVDEPLDGLPAAVVRIRTISDATGGLRVEAGRLLDGQREAGWYIRVARPAATGEHVVKETGRFLRREMSP
jgi:hypothetical protein